MADEATLAPSAPTTSPEAALATMAAMEKLLAQHRLAPLQDIKADVDAANLPAIAAKIRKLLPLLTKDQDKALLENAANVLGDVQRLVTGVVEANAALAQA